MEHKNDLIRRAALHAGATAIYVTLVAVFMSYVEKFFGGKPDTFAAPLAMLLLFVTSAAITGSLVLGKPTMLFFEKKPAEAVQMFAYTIAFLALFTFIIFVTIAL